MPKTHLDDTWMYYTDRTDIIKRLEAELRAASRQIVEMERDFNKLAQYLIDEKYTIR